MVVQLCTHVTRLRVGFLARSGASLLVSRRKGAPCHRFPFHSHTKMLLLALGPYSDIERLRAPEKIAEPGVLVAYLRTAYWPFLALLAGLWNQ